MPSDIQTIAAKFATTRPIYACEEFGGGHIHDSYLVTAGKAESPTRYLLQRINDTVFTTPKRVMENILRVTEHVSGCLRSRSLPDVERRVLSLVPAKEGQHGLRLAGGEYWRMYRFIEQTRVHLDADTPQLAFDAAYAFGVFQVTLKVLPGPPLHDTIPDFHNTPLRFARLQSAIRADPSGRASLAGNEIDALIKRKELGGILAAKQLDGSLPIRTVHNDAKISNVLFDRATNDVLCVVDLDTVMPGLSLHDFGDMVRSMATCAGEEKTCLERVEVNLSMFEALADGFLQSTRGFLTAQERQLMVAAGQVITLEQAVRYLTDYLQGDTYYKTTRAHHNLDRCRNQLQLLASLERHATALQRTVDHGQC